ncbi:hypothetical protein LAZ40_00900 [Cereibacter sphaeroides]|uniref:hypothetical protein n=1 Tax=Cereibacter sphaeroides TaxID=1063 RepID=UPI001F44EC58|nr:hypothetical protein [Cereibacter sphaeroides]MCE6957628.1 hypothetical protein [Cereibacter sphaeroides]MCE6971286.1 hypothetical protein [Cereibacter sphaeroides]
MPVVSRVRSYRHLFSVLLCLSATTANAADICEAVAIRPVPALENPGSVLAKGEIDYAITTFRVEKLTGRTSYCSHGGYCYPIHVVSGGDLLEALRMTNCAVIEGAPYDDGTYLNYSVDVIRRAVPADELRYDDIENRFLEMGLCSACADNVTRHYLEKPAGSCGALARAAIEGNPEAMAALQQFPDDCWWNY